jgi:hypothetical protein
VSAEPILELEPDDELLEPARANTTPTTRP